jgi:hypothetical protein
MYFSHKLTDVLKSLDEDYEPTRECISRLSESELKFSYQALWDGSQSSFAHMYSVNPGNFSRWLANKRNNIASINAVRNYLFSLLPSSLSALANADEQRAFHVPTKSITINEVCTKLFSLSNSLRLLIIVDADHSSTCLKSIAKYAPRRDGWFIHVVAVIARNMSTSLLTQLENSPWLSITRASHDVKNAADTYISLLCGVLLTTLPIFKTSVLPLSLVVVSRDKFAVELVEKLNCLLQSHNICQCWELGVFDEKFKSFMTS